MVMGGFMPILRPRTMCVIGFPLLYIKCVFPGSLSLLEPTNDMPRFNSLFELCFETIKKFKPSQLRLPLRRVASTSTEPPEAQYQDEFYHSLLAATSGNVRISPEYASAQGARVAGRIDFFIPIVKWGVELTRNGNRLLEHVARFTDSGAYGAWLKSADMNDYILLDFWTKSLRDQHPCANFILEIPNLYHVVFLSDHQEVQVYDNQLKVVKEPIALQENH